MMTEERIGQLQHKDDKYVGEINRGEAQRGGGGRRVVGRAKGKQTGRCNKKAAPGKEERSGEGPRLRKVEGEWE